ncbi:MULTISPECIES: aromatic ring-hydroxylating dioxygenase subunit alpha [unclassified Nodularia (in: cyanobacteria)]|uniref:aromatic ring-hydroxylating dioxygenase subunit alpha n=1 Tax=unclassified Nodularia (in: cyanobacteria) TaxID=2656917 RepID=UPI00187EF7E2|nr:MULTISPECIES: aromatic ring-hydroxylating dioxygenase subunit alpha [unclassified Nodularia (in: cyanobacteria)]MBE9201494.1 aromatic ring-hydroxylating dioxygenase subunit alpha [Nodularia sp. LEGE 06071]MCC2691422.1 aromatic ring-hydroxylating dioxygenase subunit alpha [Nodularia sp. LEGE 04288]
MLKNFWYACEFSSAVTKNPQQIAMLNQKFVLYRNSQGQVVVLKDQCSHRGAALSMGWLEDNCIRCPYHGWKFQADGKCVQIPSNDIGVPIPKKANVNSYPVQEKYGFIWLFYGDLPESERPPIPALPEFDDPNLHRSFLDFSVNTHYTRVIENALDVSHSPIVHANSFGAGFAEDSRFEMYDIQDESWGISAKSKYKNYTKPKGLFKLFFREKSTDINLKCTFYLPNITKLETSSNSIKIVNFAIHLPVDENTTISKRIHFRSFLRYSWLDGIFLKYYTKIHGEDITVSESQYPKVIPESLSTEVHVNADAFTLNYRQLRQKYLAMGWGLKANKIASDNFQKNQIQHFDTAFRN